MQIEMHTSPQLRQTMTTELIHQLEVLQLSTVDLIVHIQEKALENPLLQIEEIFYKKNDVTWNSGVGHRQDRDMISPEHPLSNLYEQIPLKNKLTKKQEQIFKFLIESLDHHLFLNINTEEIAQYFHIEQSDLEEMISYLQQFEPFGIGCRNSIDFMIQQIHIYDDAPKLAKHFIEHELPSVAKLEINYLAIKYNTERQEIIRTIQFIKSLQPYPFHNRQLNQTSNILPDVEIHSIDGEFIVEINDRLLPKITLNESYIKLLKNSMDYKKYYKECLKNAQLLIQSVDERSNTLFKLTNWLISEQRTFFEKGLNFIKPLNLSDAAQVLNLHESTISRAIRDKYLLFQNKLYTFKQLFPLGFNKQQKIGMTSHSIKQRIRSLIEQENVAHPISDQQIVDLLFKSGITISRRTVTKYREEMLIPNSKKRRIL